MTLQTPSDARTSIHLDIGCGANPRNPYNCHTVVGIDIVERLDESNNIQFLKCDPSIETLPFPDSYFTSVSAFDFLEHVPRLIYLERQPFFPFIHLMNEIHRVLIPDGCFIAVTPIYPKVSAFSDPTHVNFITKDSLKYFTTPFNWAAMYGFVGSFSTIHNKEVNFKYYTDSFKPQPLIKRIIRKAHQATYPRTRQHIAWNLLAIK